MSEIYKTKTKQEAAMEYSLINSSVILFERRYAREMSGSISSIAYLNQSEDFPAVNQGDTYLSIPGDGVVLRRGMNGILTRGIVLMEALLDQIYQVGGSRLSMNCSFPAKRLQTSKQTW